MGQRLCLSVIYDGKEIANSYYHWSAYTMSTIELINCFISYYKNSSNQYTPQERAILALQATGATFPRRELMIADKECPWFNPLKTENGDYLFKEGGNRNDGIIGVTEVERASTRSNGEGFATINLDTQTIDFDVYCWYENINELNQWVDKKIEKTEDIPEIGYDLRSISFVDFEYFGESLANLDGNYWRNGTEIYGVIA